MQIKARGFISPLTLIFIVGAIILVGVGWRESRQPPEFTQRTQPVAAPTSATTTASSGAATETATIDQDVLRQETPPQGLDWAPALSGSASGLEGVYIYVNGKQAIYANVTDGRWKAGLPNSKASYPSGTYAIEIKDEQGNALAAATITVIDAITVDKGSWVPQGRVLNLTGTAASLSKLFIVVFNENQPRNVVATSTVLVANERWSYTTNLSPGTYFIWIEDGTKPITWYGNSPQGIQLWVSSSDELTVVK
ncbi:MAG: hypothetical protein KGI78_01905 [Patescibacteria group bacterium]|nr:hypothetical protein [Patescibacteria group bacterium]MDE1944080.1 hypothetical protein [Patescibacteria group bacterium]MDE1945473.1 hypothetical protein [Patescibacteria group bacterium]MDE2057588.1 hypothetical protein [Patescibacteria group bacterium]